MSFPTYGCNWSNLTALVDWRIPKDKSKHPNLDTDTLTFHIPTVRTGKEQEITLDYRQANYIFDYYEGRPGSPARFVVTDYSRGKSKVRGWEVLAADIRGSINKLIQLYKSKNVDLKNIFSNKVFPKTITHEQISNAPFLILYEEFNHRFKQISSGSSMPDTIYFRNQDVYSHYNTEQTNILNDFFSQAFEVDGTNSKSTKLALGLINEYDNKQFGIGSFTYAKKDEYWNLDLHISGHSPT